MSVQDKPATPASNKPKPQVTPVPPPLPKK
jgi:hypothetical protein